MVLCSKTIKMDLKYELRFVVNTEDDECLPDIGVCTILI